MSADSKQMDDRDDVSDVDSEAYLGDEQGNLNQQDQEVADLQGAEAGDCPNVKESVYS